MIITKLVRTVSRIEDVAHDSTQSRVQSFCANEYESPIIGKRIDSL